MLSEGELQPSELSEVDGSVDDTVDLTPGDELRSKAEEFKTLGNEKFQKANYKGALIDYKKGLLHEPNNSDLHANLSAAYLHLEKFVEAEEHAVYAIHLRPDYYKGYLRAAKAAHGKGVTRIAIARLTTGLAIISDPNGIKELTRLRNQYTSYMSLKRNADLEMNVDIDRNESEEDTEDGPDSSDSDDSNDDQHPPEDHAIDAVVDIAPESLKTPKTKSVPATTTEEPKVVPVVKDTHKLKAAKEPARIEGPTNAAAPVTVENTKEATVENPKEATVENTKEPTVENTKEATVENTKEATVENTKETTVENTKKATVLPEPKPLVKGASTDKCEEKPRDRFLEMCKELTKDPLLTKHIAEFKEHLTTAGEAFLSGNYRKAADCYKAAKELVGFKIKDYEIDDRQYHVIKYAYCTSLINSGTYDDILKALHSLEEMKTYEFSIPALHIQRARAYHKLNRFRNALEPLDAAQYVVDTIMIFPTFTWPGTNKIIEETTSAGIKNAIKELSQMCKFPPKPTAVCRFDNCLKTGTHIIPCEMIYDSDPDFNGYVRMICQEKCHIDFHISCWKSYKESVCGMAKTNDKDLIGRRCATTDCVNSEGEPSVVISIEIIDSDGQVKFVHKQDPKAAVGAVDAKKSSKKKKSKLDDKEKASKPRKVKEKKVREVKKPVAIAEGEEDPALASAESKRMLQSRIQSLAELREINFGLGDQYWNPKQPFYGRLSESMNANAGFFYDQASDESVEVKDAKEFLYSYFMSILKDEGPLKQSEVEDLWKDSAGDFCDITLVLPNMKSMCELLLESTTFCQLEDYICLAEQLDEGYEMVKTEVSGVVSFLMTNGVVKENDNKRNAIPSSSLSDGNHPQSTDSQATISISSSEDEIETVEYNSGEESEEFSDEESSEEEDIDFVTEAPVDAVPNENQPEEPVMPEVKPPDETGKFSLEEMLNEMTRVKNIFMKSTCEAVETNLSTAEVEANKEGEESTSTNETFETAHGSSVNVTDDTKNSAFTVSESSNENEHEKETFYSDDHDSDTETHCNADEVLETAEKYDEIEELIETMKSIVEDNVQTLATEDIAEIDQDSTNNAEHEACQREASAEEEPLQMTSANTTDELSQKMVAEEMYEELRKKVEELSSQVATLNEENSKLTKDIADKEASNKQLKTLHDQTLTRLREENKRALDAQKTLQEKLKLELSRKDHDFKLKQDILVANMNKIKNMYATLLVENTSLKKNLNTLTKDCKDLEESLKTKMTVLKDFETQLKCRQERTAEEVKQAKVAHLSTIKLYWENQISLLKKHCVEKISEMHRWFSMFPSEEVEDLPSWELIRQNIMQWKDVSVQVHQIETSFEEKCKAIESKMNQGENVMELYQLQLPILPDEPTPLPLDQIHKEITDKQRKMISELNQLVASQQLEIEKSKETNQQFQQLMNTHQMVPRVNSQTPMATAFGNLALLQYPFSQTLPSLYNQTAMPTRQDTAKVGDAPKLLQTSVQTLLQESSKNTMFTNAPSLQSSGKQTEAAPISRGQTPTATAAYPYLSNSPLGSSLSFGTLPQMPLSSPLKEPKISVPPSPMGVAQSLLKNSAMIVNKKDSKPAERSVTPQQESSKTSRESTPAPTPEKSKKRKKSKSESKDSVDAKLTVSASASVDRDTHKEDDAASWNLVMPRSAIPKHPAPPPAPASEAKFKNKKKLLDKLQLKFPTTPMKDLDDMVKLVREQNNGSLSGLPFDEIETRVERLITKRQFQKTSTMGLDKFSKAAWGPVKQQENITWTSLQLEECTICLDPMGKDRTRVDCNHEFHTECLRAWLKEKSTCPLCNKFTTMPDEFPAL